MNRRLQILLGSLAVAGGFGVGLLAANEGDEPVVAEVISTFGTSESVKLSVGRFKARFIIPGLAKPENIPGLAKPENIDPEAPATPSETTTPAAPPPVTPQPQPPPETTTRTG